MQDDPAVVKAIQPLGFPWPTLDPFLFCVYHQDFYPAGDIHQGVSPIALKGRSLGNDFVLKDGWRMYHGTHVPGFPRHPHRGFETVTIARKGFIDHSDSMGATARFGQGDVQWMTAGRGVEHCEMFPLRNVDGPNPGELFQIWLNLPAKQKLVVPHFSMLWSHTQPRLQFRDPEGRTCDVTVHAGHLGDTKAPQPPPESWASDPKSDIAIWTLKMAPGARWTLPTATAGVNRALYSFSEGAQVQVGNYMLAQASCVQLSARAEVQVINHGGSDAEFLYLQGRPIAEAVVQYGPFVMNTAAEIQRAMQDYQRGLFGRWPWPSEAPVHARDQGRFAQHADGKREDPPHLVEPHFWAGA